MRIPAERATLMQYDASAKYTGRGSCREVLPLHRSRQQPHPCRGRQLSYRPIQLCSGATATPRAYFETVRKARAAVKIPPDYDDLKEPLSVTAGSVADAFSKANPGLPRGAIAIGCAHQRLTEVRLCLSKDLTFRDCPEMVKRSCRRDQLVMPPTRGI